MSEKSGIGKEVSEEGTWSVQRSAETGGDQSNQYRWKEMKAGKGYTKSKVSAYGPRRPVLQEKQDT